MNRITSMKTALLLPLAILSVALVTPASANWFSIDPSTGMRRNVGSAPSPTPQDIGEYRKAQQERANGKAVPATEKLVGTFDRQ